MNTVAVRVDLAALQHVLIHGTGNRTFHLDISGTIDHGLVDVRHGGIGALVCGVDCGTFHLGECHGSAHQGCVAVGFQEGCGLFHARHQLDPVVMAIDADPGVAGIGGIAGLHIHDIGCLDAAVYQRLDLTTGGMTQANPGQIAGTRSNAGGLVPPGYIEGTGRQVAAMIGDEHEHTTVGRIVTH